MELLARALINELFKTNRPFSFFLLAFGSLRLFLLFFLLFFLLLFRGRRHGVLFGALAGRQLVEDDQQ